MYESWDALFKDYLYKAPDWMEWFTVSWPRELLWIPGILFGLVSLGLMAHWALFNKNDYRRLGWMRGKGTAFGSTLQSWFYD